MALRYSGALKISVVWKDDAAGAARLHFAHGGYYDVVFVQDGGTGRHKVLVGAPASLRHAVDSPEAYDSAAHAALSFANDEDAGFGELAAYDADGSGWHIARTYEKRRGGG